MYLHLALNGKSQFFINVCLCVSQGDRLRVEILSLSFNPSSSVALDYSVHQVYVEYRLLGIPMETTETPMSLRKPTDGQEIHYNFTRGKLITFMCLNQMLFHGKSICPSHPQLLTSLCVAPPTLTSHWSKLPFNIE